jgi:Chlor_Arch_YYY domain
VNSPLSDRSLRTRRWWHAPWATVVALICILLLGAYFRTMNIFNWDGGYGFHPDEGFYGYMVSGAVKTPSSLGEWFDSAVSPLNPRNVGHTFFVYGSLPVTLSRIVGDLLPYFGIDDLPPYKVGRALAVFFDVGSILMTFLIGKLIAGRRVALLGAFFAACAVMMIQQAHFFTVDAFSTFFVLLSLYWIVRIGRGDGWPSYVWMGISVGLAMAAGRATMATLGVIGAVAAFQAALSEHTPRDTQVSDDPTGSSVIEEDEDEAESGLEWFINGLTRFMLDKFPILVLAGVCCFFSFRTFQPDAFIGSRPDSPPIVIDNQIKLPQFIDTFFQGKGYFDIRPDPRFIDNLRTIAAQASGEFDWPPSVQWANRTNYIFPLENMILWGMGLPLGVTVWVAFLWLGWRMLRKREWLIVLPLWIWVAFYFGWQGQQFAKTMRYMLPIYSPLMLFAGIVLVQFWEWARKRRHEPALGWLSRNVKRYAPAAAIWTILIVSVGTYCWAYAYTRIYTRDHTRLMASRWLLDNMPPGSYMTNETWDYPLPVSADGRDPWRVFKGIDISPYAEDDLVKYTGSFGGDGTWNAGLIDQLDQADYIVMSSNRVYDSIIRLPMRYPVTIRYYHYLFNGELGFEMAADITSYPTFLGIQIPDQSAEEAFTVYDHPRVMIFRKTPRYSRENTIRLLTSDVNWDEVYKLPTIKGGRAPTALRFTPSQWPSYIEGGTWSKLFSPITSSFPLIVWLAVLYLLGLSLFALLYHLLPMLPDRGWTLARALAILLVSYGAWLLGSFKLMAFTPASVWLVAAPLIIVGALVAANSRAKLRIFWRERRSALIASEALFLLAFFALLLIRYMNPDLWHPDRGGEKPMDLAFLTAVLKSSSFPPYDPWFAGGMLNYYYYGFVYVGSLVHLTAITPEVAYNLAVPTIFALTALGCFGVVYNLLALGRKRSPLAQSELMNSRYGRLRERRAIVSGLLAAVFVVLLGNMAQAIWYLPGTATPPGPGEPIPSPMSSYAAQQELKGRAEWAFWDATRIIDGTVNEFPFFTFLFADLHAHMIVMPLSLAVLILSIALVRNEKPWIGRPAASYFEYRGIGEWLVQGLLLLALAFTSGALRVTNTWDYPTFTGLAAGTIALIGWHRWRSGAPWQHYLGSPLAQIAIVLLLGNIFFRPFTAHFVTESSGIQAMRDTPTTLWNWIQINGLWFYLLFTTGLLLARRYARLPLMLVAALSGGLLLCLLVGLLSASTSPILLLPLLISAIGLAWLLRKLPLSSQLPYLWALGGFGLWVLVEYVTVKGDVGRLNTVFKFGLHAWILFGLAAGVAVPWMWRQVRHWQAAGSWAWRALAVLLIGASLIYPLTATPVRVGDRYDKDAPWTLDGLAYLERVTRQEEGVDFALKEDADAIKWIRANISGTPVMLEAQQEAYRWGARIAINTGLPTVLGWTWHEIQQRGAVNADVIVRARQEAIRTIYTDSDVSNVARLIRNYGIQYIYFGGLERAIYGTQALETFDSLIKLGSLEKVYDQGSTSIYRVLQPFSDGILTTDMGFVKPTVRTIPPLPLSERLSELPAIDEYAWNSLGQSSWGALLLWLLAWYGILLLGLPLAWLLFDSWRDMGFAWARLLGILLFGYAVWMPTSLGIWYYRLGGGVLGGLLLVLLLNWAILAWQAWREGKRSPDGPLPLPVGANLTARITWLWRLLGQGCGLLLRDLRAHGRVVLLSEALFLIGFALMALIRAYNPDVWHPYFGGEKPMEFGFLNAILRSPVMPPFDPFVSNERINYYYYGSFLMSLPIKITGIAPAIGFNLAIATLFGITLVAAFALSHELTKRIGFGFLGALVLTVAGNLGAVVTSPGSPGLAPLLQAINEKGIEALFDMAGSVGEIWYWGPSRIMPGGINEFPYWAFIFADLHAHLIALPFTILAIALAYQLLRFPTALARWEAWSDQASLFVITLLATALNLGGLAIGNAWDFPTYTALTGLALLGRAWIGRDRLPQLNRWSAPLRRLLWLVQAGLLAIGVALLAMWLHAPFFDNYSALVSGVGLVTQSSSLHNYLIVFGLFVVLVVPFIFSAIWSLIERRWDDQQGLRWTGYAIVLLIASVLAVLTWSDQPNMARVVFACLFGLSTGLLFVRQLRPATWFILALSALVWAVSLGVEVIYIKDHLDGSDSYRMNTIFKFGVQIWTLLAIAATASVPKLLFTLKRIGGVPLQTIGSGVMIALLLFGLVFPFVGTPSRLANRFADAPAPTLDGLAFMKTARFSYDCATWGGCANGATQAEISLAPDAAAMEWMNKNLSGTPIVLQSDLWFYRAYGVRIAANTGFPTLISGLHANEQHDPSETGRRSGYVNQIYNGSDVATTLRLLALYNIDYIYVGAIENALYAPTGLQKLQSLVGTYLEVVYDQPGARLYKVLTIPFEMRQAPRYEFPPDPQPLPPPVAERPTEEPAQVPSEAPAVQPQPAPGETPRDLATLEQLQKENPTSAPIAFGLAEAYRDAGRLEDAARVLALVSPYNMEDIALHHLWGDILGALGRYDEATYAYEVAIAAQTTAGNMNKLGSAQVAWGRYAEARDTLTKAILLDSNAADPHYFLALVSIAEGKNDEARTELNRYLELSPDGRWSGEARQYLQTLP